MHFVKKVFKIGGSLAIGLPRKLIEELEIKEGDLIFMEKYEYGFKTRDITNIMNNRDQIKK